jgi:hydroxymethylglutaryl-CoA lyase
MSRKEHSMSTGLPSVHVQASLNGPIRIYEVGPRDGLQAEKGIVPTAIKIEFIRRLAAAGLRMIEATSFVAPRWVPQLADAAEVMAGIARPADVRFPVPVPNEKGLTRALAADADTIAVFASATETFARKNLNTTVEGALAMFAPVVATARERRHDVRGYVSMCFGDPDEGPVALDSVVTVARKLIDMGCERISLGDTIGVGTPGHVHALLDALAAADIGPDRIAMHFHDTYGQALANVVAALDAGVREFDASAGGLGGCPYARSATGNLATEDLVWMLRGLGLDPGIDLEQLVATSVWMAGVLGRPSPSRVVTALAPTVHIGGAP